MIALTIDLDWAPDWAIEDVALELERGGVKATWFVTHGSVAVERLRARPDLFELGAHPNFLPGSTHGSTPGEVLARLCELVPEAVSFRTHGLVHGTGLVEQILDRTPWRIDATPLLPGVAMPRPARFHWRGREMYRVAAFFEDDVELEQPAPRFALGDFDAPREALRVFSFHPIHIALNAASMEPYRRLRVARPRLWEATREDVESLRGEGDGTATLFGEVVEALGRSGSRRLRDLCQR